MTEPLRLRMMKIVRRAQHHEITPGECVDLILAEMAEPTQSMRDFGLVAITGHEKQTDKVLDVWQTMLRWAKDGK